MTFDPHSLERLRELGRQLPKPLPKSSQPSKTNLNTNSTTHRIETEENPQALFKELIKASSDGNIPSHLINRLKELEEKQLEQNNINEIRTPQDLTTNDTKPSFTKPAKKRSQEEILYASFNRLLLEEED